MNEGTDMKPRLGFITTEPGAVLEIQLFPWVSTSSSSRGIDLLYLQSYEHMGKVRLTCRASCSCDPGTHAHT